MSPGARQPINPTGSQVVEYSTGMHPFGAAAVKLGFTTPERIEEALRLQAECVRAGQARSLQEILGLPDEKLRAVIDHLRVPHVAIPGYELLGPIGKGGMGAVYQARQIKMNRLVAVKFLSDELAADEEFVARFIAEAQTAAQFNHKHLVAAYDAGTVGGHVYFVMEYVKGRTLKDAVEKHGPLGERQALLAAAAVAEALQALESRRMLHRDIKPENIMLTDDGVVKLCDFGLAKGPPRTGVIAPDANPFVTQSLMGTPAFMAPEQIRGEKLDIRADFYALGATLYTLVTGRWTYDGATPVAILQKHLDEAVPDPRALVPKLSPGFAALVMRLMAKKRENRPADCAALLASLRGLLGERAPAARRTQVAAAAAMAAVLVVAGILLASRRPDPPPPPPPAPVVDPAREAGAQRAFAKADGHYDRREWADAKASYEAFGASFAGTEHARANAGKLARRLAACDVEIADAGRAAKEERSRIEAEIAAGRWKEASTLIERSKQRAAFADLQAACARELEAAALLESIEGARAKGLWHELRDLLGRLTDEMRETKTVAARASWLHETSRETQQELEAAALLGELRALAAAHAWDRAAPRLRQMVERYRGTRTYRDSAADVDTMIACVRQAHAEAAKSLFDAALQHIEAKKYEEALDVLHDLVTDAADTDFVRTRQAEIAEARRKCDDALARRREQDAEAVHKDALRLHKERKHREARAALDRLARSFGDTQYVRQHEREIAALLDEVGLLTPFLDFERPALWIPGGDHPQKPKIKQAGEAFEGEHCARVWLPKPVKDKMAIAIAIGPKMPDGAFALVFGARAENPAALKMSVGVFESRGPGEYEVFFAQAEFGAKWKEHEVKFSEMVFIAGAGAGANKKLDLTDVRAVAFTAIDVNREASFFVDDIRVRVKK